MYHLALGKFQSKSWKVEMLRFVSEFSFLFVVKFKSFLFMAQKIMVLYNKKNFFGESEGGNFLKNSLTSQRQDFLKSCS